MRSRRLTRDFSLSKLGKDVLSLVTALSLLCSFSIYSSLIVGSYSSSTLGNSSITFFSLEREKSCMFKKFKGF
jgi:hypothetical protein